MSAASIYEGQTTLIPVVNAFGNVFEEWQIAVAAQTIVNINSFQYTPGTNTLLVFKNGLFQRVGFDYTEFDSDTVVFTTPLALNDHIAFFAFATSGVAIPNGGGVPNGGTTGQALVKNSNNDYDSKWVSLTALASLLDAPITNLASASTVNLAPLATTTRNIALTGSATVGGFQVANGQLFAVKVQGSPVFVNSVALVCPGGLDIRARTGDSFFLRATADNQVELLAYVRATAPSQTLGGCCRLVKSGANIALNRYNGITVPINGSNEIIPAVPPTLAPAGLAPLQLYYIYVYMNAGVMTLEASTTGHTTDPLTGVEIKIADATRTLVGMVRPIAGPAFKDSLQQRFVSSYFNRQRKTAFALLQADRSFSNTASFLEFTLEMRGEVLAWADAPIDARFNGVVGNTVSLGQSYICGGLDGATQMDGGATFQAPAASAITTMVVNATAENVSEGYHFVTMLGVVNAGIATVAFNGGIIGRQAVNMVTTLG